MSAHLTTEQIENYRRRSLPVAGLVMADKHLALCAACRARLGEASGPDRAAYSIRAGLLKAGLESNHIAYELLEKYVDGRADPIDREVVESHVRFCHLCLKEMNDLLSFASTMAESQKARFAAVAVAGQRAEGRAEKVGWLGRLFGLGGRPSLPLAVAAMAATLVIAVTASVLILLRSKSGAPSNSAERASVANSNAGVMARRSDDIKGNLNTGALSPVDPAGHIRGLTKQPVLSPDSKTITLTLVAGQATSFELPRSVRSVNLLLAGLKAGDRSYSLTLSDQSGRATWRQEVIKMRDDIFITIAAEELNDGQYTLTASADKDRARFPILVIKR
jgi:hypothetical protein